MARMTLPFYTTTITVTRGNAGPVGEGNMVDPWDATEVAAAGSTVIATGVRATLTRLSRMSVKSKFDGAAREEDRRILRVDVGTDLRLGDNVVDDQTGWKWRIESMVNAQAGLPTDNLRADVVRVSGGA
jgi:hypothetical protein